MSKLFFLYNKNAHIFLLLCSKNDKHTLTLVYAVFQILLKAFDNYLCEEKMEI